MPALTNVKWESFAQARAAGMPASRAIIVAGYKHKNAATSWAVASRLMKNAMVQDRIRELSEKAARNMVVTKESLTLELDQAIAFAYEQGQPSAVIAGIQAKAKLHGLDAPQKVEVDYHWDQLSEDEIAFEFATLIAEARAAAGVAAPKMIEGERR
jgi:hypothetical protein